MKKLMPWIKVVPPRRACFNIGLMILLGGCDREEVKVYQVPNAPPQISREVPAQSDLTWTLPEGWQEVPAGQMRLASFAVTGADGKKADVSIVPLGGMAGGELGNVNRWRGQVGLPPITTDDLAGLGEKMEVAGSDVTLFDFSGKTTAGEKSRILVTMFERGDTSWFFKMTGDENLVAEQKPKFIAFLKSLKFGSSAPAEAPTAMENNSSKPQWTVPSTWTEEAPTQMLLAKFSAKDDDAQAEITVSVFPGDVGGLAANINRWRGQIGLSPLDEAAAVQSAKSIDVQSEKASLIELNGHTGQLIGVVLPHGDQTWFFKMTGDGKVVAHEKDAFLKFVQTAKLPHA